MNLEKNIELAQQQQISHQDKQQAIDDEDEKEPEIGIAVRAVPLIDLLKSAIAAKLCDVGVGFFILAQLFY